MNNFRLVVWGVMVTTGIAACSDSSGDGGGPATPLDGGPGRDGSTSQPEAGAPDDAAPASDAATASSNCAYSLAGDATQPRTDAPYACAQGAIRQSNGTGDFTATFGGGFLTANNENYNLACTIASPTAPAAGTTWSIGTDAHKHGNCQITRIVGSTATSYAATSSDAQVTGSASITFASATLVHGTAHPNDVYYLYDLTLTASIPGLSAGTTILNVSGTFKSTALPIGS